VGSEGASIAISERSYTYPESGTLYAGSTQLVITCSTADGWHTLALSGELDLASVQTLDRAAQELELDAAEGSRWTWARWPSSTPPA
jgi:hypothetical protein